MADSFFDTAGGLQQVPTVDIVEKPAQPYVATDGSMQSALAVNVGAGGEIIEDGDPVTVKPANDVSPTYQGTITDGNPPSVTLPATVALVPDNAVIALRTSAGTNAGNVTADVNVGALTAVVMVDGNGIVGDGASVIISKADNTGLLATGTANVPPATDLLENVALPANYAILQDGDDNHILNNNDDSSGGAMQINVAANVPSFKLFNAVQRVATHMAPITIVAANAKTAGASFAIDQGVFQNFPLGSATDTILSTGDAIEIENQGATQDVMGTVEIAVGVAKAKLPASSALVANNVAITVPVTGTYVDTITPQVNAAGVITGFTLS